MTAQDSTGQETGGQKVDSQAAAGEAWQQGLLALRRNERHSARQWFERALRLVPDDPRISLDLANLCIALGGTPGGAEALSTAAAQFGRLATRYDLAAAWLGLMAARRLAGDPAAAAQALAAMLHRHCVPDGPQFSQVATMIAAAAAAPGWCGANAAGHLLVSLSTSAPPLFTLDGAAFTPRKVKNGFALPLSGRLLAIHAPNGEALLGSPLDLPALRLVEGIVDDDSGALTGWASRPAAPGAPPDLHLTDANNTVHQIEFAGLLDPDLDYPFLPRHKFICPASILQTLTPPFRLAAPGQKDIFGSPADFTVSALPKMPPAKRGKPVSVLPPRRRLSIVMPVYRGLTATQDCLNALFMALPRDARIIIVDDATPEPDLAAWLDTLAAARRITLRRHATNQGFPAAANTGIAAAGRSDVLLLNSDTLVPPGAIETLLNVAYARPDTGSVTPLSNEATILNYPDPAGQNPVPDLAATIQLNALAKQANDIAGVEIPTGIGFCMLLRHDCLAATGLFRGEIFAQGYGEENDWCLRARQLGYTHMAAPGAYVAHVGGVSFRGAGRALNQRNANRLNRLYPGYHAMILDVIAADALAPSRRKLDLLRFATGRQNAGAVLLISHNHGGGVARRIAEEMAAIRAAGQRPLLLFPATPTDPVNTPFPWPAQLTDGDPNARPGAYPNLRFTLPAELPALLRLLQAERIGKIILHHALGHHPLVHGLAARLGVPQEIVIHDYASFCPRVNLLTRPEPDARLRYCGEPNIAGCVACIDTNGNETFEALGVTENLGRSAASFATASRITAPSTDAAQRIARHFPGIKPQVTPWEDDTLPVTLTPPKPTAPRKIVIVGGIGPAKGFDLLIDCANDAVARGLPLEFIVAGASADDAKLLETGRIFVTGPYEEANATDLIRSLGADLAFLPSIWPETWCFTLSEAWRAGLYVVAFDLGAQAARIRATKRGALLPLGLPASRINDALLAWQPNSGNSPPANKAMF